jgi:ATP-dependent DNA helicase PIF1
MLNNEQNAALFAVLEGKSIFLTGSPGTGKSYTLKAIIKVLQEANKRIAVTASTGCSAVLINGQTIHSYLRMGVNNDTADQIVMSIKKYKSKFLLNV